MLEQNVEQMLLKGRRNGTIRNVDTITWAFFLEDMAARAWLDMIVNGDISEDDALMSMGPLPTQAAKNSHRSQYDRI